MRIILNDDEIVGNIVANKVTYRYAVAIDTTLPTRITDKSLLFTMVETTNGVIAVNEADIVNIIDETDITTVIMTVTGKETTINDYIVIGKNIGLKVSR